MKLPSLPLGPLLVNPLLLSQICKADGSMQVAQVDCFHPAQITIDYARLFAAAPELLVALNDMVATFGALDDAGKLDDAESELIDRARAAVHKAVGSAA